MSAATLAALIVLSGSVRAQEPRVGARIDRLELVEAGFYDSAKSTVTGSTPAVGAAGGVVHDIDDVSVSTEPPAVSARIGVGFGVRFRSFGDRDGERATLRSVWKIPDPGVHNPDIGNIYRHSLSDFSTTIGTSHWRGYSFDQPWEVVPGTWTIEIWQDDRKLLERSFAIR